MKDRIKTVFCSEKGMAGVNLLFFLSLFIRGRGVVFAACALWTAYLAGCIRRTPSKMARLVYGVLIAFAAFLIAANLYVWLGQMG